MPQNVGPVNLELHVTRRRVGVLKDVQKTTMVISVKQVMKCIFTYINKFRKKICFKPSVSYGKAEMVRPMLLQAELSYQT